MTVFRDRLGSVVESVVEECAVVEECGRLKCDEECGYEVSSRGGSHWKT